MELDVHLFTIVGGLLQGGIYALTAIGLTLLFGVSKILNIAHGDFQMLGAFVGVLMIAAWGLNPFVTLGVILPFFIAIGVIIYVGLFKTISAKPPEEVMTASILITLGLSLVIADTSSYAIGYSFGTSFFGITYPLPSVGFADLYFPGERILSLIAIIVLTIGLWVYIKRTLAGKVIRAVSEDIEAAVSLGAKITSASAVSFGIGIGLAAVAGVFLALVTRLSAYSGMPLTIKALTIVILGGMGSFPGSVIGGITLGLAESYTALYAGANWSPAVAIIILFLVLVTRSQGLFGER